jgi:hypothetical protein
MPVVMMRERGIHLAHWDLGFWLMSHATKKFGNNLPKKLVSYR